MVNDTHIVLKDMFSALGRLTSSNQIETTDRNKLNILLEDIDKTSASETFTISSKGKKKSKEEQNLDCLKLETVPIVLTQFKPTARKGEEALITWRNFMIFVDDLLTSLEVYKFIVIDKEHQKEQMTILKEEGGSETICNQQVNGIMAELIGVYNQGIKRIKKEEMKQYQSQTTVDLLSVREYVLSKFVSAYEFTGSHKTAREMTKKLAFKKYNILEGEK